MRHAKSGGNVADPGASARERHGALFQNAIERLAVHKLHDEIRRLRGFVNAHIVQGENARVRDLTDDACFLEKFLAGFAACDFRGEDFDGDNAADEGIVRADDAAEGASAHGIENFVTANFHGGPFRKTRESPAVVRVEKGSAERNEAEVPIFGGTEVPGRTVRNYKKTQLLLSWPLFFVEGQLVAKGHQEQRPKRLHGFFERGEGGS